MIYLHSQQALLRDSDDDNHRTNPGLLTRSAASSRGATGSSLSDYTHHSDREACKRIATIFAYYNNKQHRPGQIRLIPDQFYQNLEAFIFDDDSEVDANGLGLMSDQTQKTRLAVRLSSVGYSSNFRGASCSIA